MHARAQAGATSPDLARSPLGLRGSVQSAAPPPICPDLAGTSRQATAPTARGPWTPDARATGGFFPGAISRPCVEGAAALRLGPRRYSVLFDAYRVDCELRAPPPCARLDGAPPERSGMRLRAGADAAGLCAFEPRRRGFGGMVSDDLRRWTDVSESFDVPEGYKHGTAIALSREALNAVCLPSAAAGGVGEAGAASVRVASSELCRGVT